MENLIQHFINGLGLGGIYALIALGYTMVYGVLQLINFAHADVYMIGAFTAYFTAKLLGLQDHPGISSVLILLLASSCFCALIGVGIERLAYRPLRKAPKLNLLITAIGVSLLLQNLAQVIFGADPKVFPQVIEDQQALQFFGVPIGILDITILALVFGILALLHGLIFYTRFGRALRAISTNLMMSASLGVPTNRMISLSFALGSALAGVGSVLVGMKYPKIEPMMGVLIGMKAFVAAVFGGIGNLTGAVVGGMLMGLSEEFVVGYISSTYRDALAFGLLILVLLVRPQGLFGKNAAEKV